jgi:integrase
MAPIYRKDRPLKWKAQVRDENGKLRARCFEKRSDAMAWETHMRTTRQLVRDGLQRPTMKVLVYDFVADWVKKAELTDLPGTFQPKARNARHVVRWWGTRLMHSVTREEIEERLDELMEVGPPDERPTEPRTGKKIGKPPAPWSPATRNRMLAMLHKLFEDARLSRPPVLKENPTDGIPYLEEKPTRKVAELTEEQTELFIRQMELERGLLWGTLSETLAGTGARIGNVLALPWEDVDFERNRIRIRRMLDRATGEVVDRTKGQGEGGGYTIPMLPRLRGKLLAWKKETRFRKPADFIFTMDGKPFTYDSVTQRMERTVRRAKLPKITPHAFRHWLATQMKNAGFTLAERKEMLGHESESMTERYTHDDIESLSSRVTELGFGKAAEGK